MEIQIRHLEPTDNQDIFDIYRHSSVLENTSQKPFLSSDQVERLFGHSDHFTLVAEVSGKVVGHITLFMTTKVRDRHCAGLAIAINPEMHGKGVGKALMLEAINQADNWLNLVRLELEVHADNHSAIALYERVGFQLEGTKRLSTFKAGKYIDMLLMSRIRPDYR
ncbi:GNAT family N-acetyltransferase [Vibrio splendidus]|uniref:GNAT family N-acetyltransferase n=1 Tax=Vibrio splendidus TaxID=29497 RepID=UPI000D3655A0|nr:GNAT family N-acetyltransferase [Vibrio splendidus]MDH6025644.1 GNAT family N-acetyltransferase [Vibrio splendidus]PTO61468.1 GNAT family N-acetyltransferase [Vibrio splendidus]PTO64870.1 GNAT family N-acetyltransferase [Vibrio splendidus]PTO82696.1 GNAT family N-acetyltransferase [Vibrio splendidus]PTP38528.1 GNAT family N-acetyltransferase [Vibrio splendidus]